MNKKTLGITVLGDFLVSEGIDAVLDNLTRVGATAVALNPTVTVPGDKSDGVWQPPADAGHSPRRFDRPLFGKHALWLRSAASFHPDPSLYRRSPYGPRKTSHLTDEAGPLIGRFIEVCADAGLDVYLQVGAAQPTGLRDEDRPHLPDGTLPRGRIADVASLSSPAMREYNRAYARDLVRHYPRITGFRIDWPEYPCYTPDEVFQDFSTHVETWCQDSEFSFHTLRRGVAEFRKFLQHELSAADLAPLAESNDAGAELARLLERFPAVGQWLRLKAALSVDLIRHWRQVVDSLDGSYRLSVHAFMPPFSTLTGFDFARAAGWSESISPKLYTLHWCLMVHQWGKWLLEHNARLDDSLVTRCLVKLLQLSDTELRQPVLDDFRYPAPDEPHPIGRQAQSRKLTSVAAAVAGRAAVLPLIHGYGPVDDFSRRFNVGINTNVDGMWVNRYGYLSDRKLEAISEAMGQA